MAPLEWQTPLFCFFFFNDTATTEIYTLSLHDALPICADCVVSDRIRRHPEQRQPHPFRLARFQRRLWRGSAEVALPEQLPLNRSLTGVRKRFRDLGLAPCCRPPWGSAPCGRCLPVVPRWGGHGPVVVSETGRTRTATVPVR